MAGTLLLISRNKTPPLFDTKIQKLKNAVDSTLGTFFHDIIYRKMNSYSFLIEFRKNDTGKFYQNPDGSWLSYEGIVFHLHDTKAHTAESLMKLYQKYDRDFPNHIDGHFVIKLYDATRDRFWVVNDIIKNKTNYVTETGDFVLFTPFLVTAGIIREPVLDQEAFNEFMWRYYLLSFRSMLKDVERLRPASLYEYVNGKLKREDYWDWPHQYTNIPFNQAVDRTAASMQESARLIHQTIGEPCIDFTMGQDTRQVISAFTNQKIPFTSSTFGKSDFYEVQSVQMMAKKYGIEHHNIQIKQDFLDNLYGNFKKAVLLSNCEEPGHIMARIMYMRENQRLLGNPLLNGQEGHFYKNGLWDEMYTFNLYREPAGFKIDMFLKLRALSKNYPDNIFIPEYLKIKANSRQYFFDVINKSLSKHLTSPVSIQADKFDCNHWLNFENVANSVANVVHNSVSILYLRRNLELALQIPVRWKFNLSKYQRAVVHYLDPRLASERTDFGGVTMTPKNLLTYFPFLFRYYHFQSTRFRNKLKMRLGLKVITHLQEAWDYLPVYQKLYAETDIRENLDYSRMNLASIILPRPWRELILKSKTSDFQKIDDYDYLLKIAGTEYFLKTARAFWDLKKE